MKKPLRSIWDELSIQSSIFASLGLVIFFSFFVNILVLTSPLYMMQVYDRVLPTSRAETLVYLSLIALAALIVFGILDAVRGYLLTRIGSLLDFRLREPVLVQAIAQSRRGKTGTRRLTDDLNTLRNYLGSTNILPFIDAPWVPFFIAIMALLHPWFGVLGVASALLLLALALANDWLSRKHLQVAAAQQNLAGEFASAAIQNAEVIQAMGMQRAVSARYRTISYDMGNANKRAGDIGSVLSSASKAVRVAVQSASLGLGAYLVITGQMTPGGMIASSILLGRALAPIEQSIGSWRYFAGAREAFRQIKGFLTSIPFAEDRTVLPIERGGLSVEALFYKTPETETVTVRNVSFKIGPGLALALVGPTASGKSTLCRLLVGAIPPSAGNVRLSGADVSMLNPINVQMGIGYLPQTVELFSGTVRDNIARLGAVDDASVIAAATAAGCHDMILRLSSGYETELGSRGMFLSGGQRQRIGLARALYGNPRLLVLDEPNANLDQDGERALVEAIKGAKKQGTTVIVVSHRSTLLEPIDLLGVLRDGVLEKLGPRDDILREIQPKQNVAKPMLVPVTDSEGNKR